jgi:hypothetical protein
MEELRIPCDTSARISASRRVNPSRFARVEAPRAAGNGTNPHCTHASAQRLRRWGRAELLEHLYRVSLIFFGAVPSEQAGVFIGTTQALPVLRRGTPIACNLLRIRIRNVCRLPIQDTNAI